MKTFLCSCGNQLFFENTLCLTCGKQLGYLPDIAKLSPLLPVDDELWHSDLPGYEQPRYRMCRNYSSENACNWMVSASDEEHYCQSCRLNGIIPDLGKPCNRQAWLRIEKAKRRLLYSLYYLHLPVIGKTQDLQGGLAFAFLEDSANQFEFDNDNNNQVLTGHHDGTITINLAEADPSTRERVREAMNEQYRTLLGHFRHESGHFYWERLINGTHWLDEFRSLFGDEKADYALSLEKYYSAGPPVDWSNNYVSAYASSHPWEDWAETWAHYLHLVDTVEMARDYELTVRGRPIHSLEFASDEDSDFDVLLTDWNELTKVLNSLNRSMGQPDAYPFTVTGMAVEKIHFVNRIIAASAV